MARFFRSAVLAVGSCGLLALPGVGTAAAQAQDLLGGDTTAQPAADEGAAALLARSPADVTTLDRDTLGRIKSDYRETLAQLHLDYLRAWVKWSHDHGYIVRNQSHGAPGNLLDLYANADIAETEIFGSTPFPIPGLRRDPADIANNNQDLPESLVVRLASSASHVAGHPLASSETATWLRDHWKEALAFVKPELDRIFPDGIIEGFSCRNGRRFLFPHLFRRLRKRNLYW